MMLILIGADRAHMIRIARRDYGKHFITYRSQLYKVYPDGLSRCYLYKWGKQAGDDEIIIYKENAIIPYNPKSI